MSKESRIPNNDPLTVTNLTKPANGTVLLNGGVFRSIACERFTATVD